MNIDRSTNISLLQLWKIYLNKTAKKIESILSTAPFCWTFKPSCFSLLTDYVLSHVKYMMQKVFEGRREKFYFFLIYQSSYIISLSSIKTIKESEVKMKDITQAPSHCKYSYSLKFTWFFADALPCDKLWWKTLIFEAWDENYPRQG